MEGDANILATRASVEVFAAAKEVCPAALLVIANTYKETSMMNKYFNDLRLKCLIKV